jgi:hypothetical protein
LVLLLETELRAKQATLDLLERSADRIANLGKSLAALDKRIKTVVESEAERSPSDVIDTRVQDDGPVEREPGEMLPIQSFMGPQKPSQNRGDGAAHGVARKLVAMIGGEDMDYPLSKVEMTIGRGRGCDIRIPSHFVSRTHAKVSTNGIATVIEDAGSKNGVLVNSEHVSRRVLRDGDIVSLGGEWISGSST